MTDTTQTTEADGSGAEAASAVSLNSRRTNPNFQRILESKWFLNSEEKGQYEQDLEALVEKLNPQSFLAWKDIEDYADKLQGERRYKPVIAAVINAKLARRKNWTVEPRAGEAGGQGGGGISAQCDQARAAGRQQLRHAQAS
jgi:hypothetical protein